MTLNELIEKLESIRNIHGGYTPVVSYSWMVNPMGYGAADSEQELLAVEVGGSFVSGRYVNLVLRQPDDAPGV